MRTVKINERVTAVDLPSDAKYITMNSNNTGIGYMVGPVARSIKLPRGYTYTFLGRESELSEEVAAEIVEATRHGYDTGYKDYDGDELYLYAIGSLASLTRVLKMDNPIFLKTTEI